MKSFLDKIDSLLIKIVVCTMSMMLFAIFFQVVARYVFHHTFGFTEEFARYMFVWTVFLGLPIVSRRGSHMVVAVFVGRLKGTPLLIMQVFSFVFSLLFMALIAIYGIQMIAMMTYQTSPGIGIRMSWVYLAIPIGSIIMILDLIEKFIRLFDNKEARFSE